MSTFDLLDPINKRARDFPDAIIAQSRGSTATALTFAEEVARKKSAYFGFGVSRSACVGLIASPPLEFLTDIYACLGLGAAIVPLGSSTKSSELIALKSAAQLTHIVGPKTIGGFSSNALVEQHDDRMITIFGGESRFVNCGVAQATSGTTGKQKIAFRSIEAIGCESKAYLESLQLEPNRDVIAISENSIQHGYGFGLAGIASIASGVRVDLLPQLSPQSLVARLVKNEVTYWVTVPLQLRLVANQFLNRSVSVNLSRLAVLSSGSVLDQGTAQLVGKVFGAQLGQIYGTTETGPISVRSPTTWQNAWKNVGVAMPGVKIAIRPLKANGEIKVLNSTQKIGRISVNSPCMLQGYWDGTRIDDHCIDRQGYFHSGDLGSMINGELFLSGRLSAAVNVGGVMVSPEEVETVILEFPGVSDVLVRSCLHPDLGEQLEAIVCPISVNVVDLRRHCLARLSPYKVPILFSAAERLAKTESGKTIR